MLLLMTLALAQESGKTCITVPVEPTPEIVLEGIAIGQIPDSMLNKTYLPPGYTPVAVTDLQPDLEPFFNFSTTEEKISVEKKRVVFMVACRPLTITEQKKLLEDFAIRYAKMCSDYLVERKSWLDKGWPIDDLPAIPPGCVEQ